MPLLRTIPRRLAALLAAVLLAFLLVLPAAAEPEIDQSKAVIDTADVLSNDTEIIVTNLSIALQERCGAQIGVYTVDYIGNNTMEGYATKLMNDWELGDAQKDNGVLILLAIGEDDYFTTRGTGLERQLSVQTLGDLQAEYLEPGWVEANYDAGVQDYVMALTERLCKLYGLSMDVKAVAYGEDAAYSEPARRQGGISVSTVVILLLVLGVVVLVFIMPRGPRGPGAPGGYGGYYRRRRPHVNVWVTPPRPRRPPPPPPGPYGGPGFGGPGFGGPRPGGGSFHAGGGSSRGGGAGRRPSGGSFGGPRPSGGSFGGPRPGGGSFRAGGGSSRGGGAGRRK